MARLPANSGAWMFIGWAAATVVLTPLTRVLAEAHDFVVKRLLWADLVLIAYAIVAGLAVLFLVLRAGRPRWITFLFAAPPLLLTILDFERVVRDFTVDRSGYPWDLVVLAWLGNMAVLVLVAAAILACAHPARRSEAARAPRLA
jgi:hypothetical protein